MSKTEDFTKYIEVYDRSLRGFVETMFNNEYREGWILTDIVRMSDGNWLLKWGKDLTATPTPSKEQQ